MERASQHVARRAPAGPPDPLASTRPSPGPCLVPQGAEPDEMILRAGDYLVGVLHTARRLLWARRSRRLTRLALVGLAALLAVRWARRRSGPRPTAAAALHS